MTKSFDDVSTEPEPPIWYPIKLPLVAEHAGQGELSFLT